MINEKRMKNLIIALFLVVLLGACSNNTDKEAVQPNFLFVLVDDQPYDALGVNGRYPFLQTPNMDRLAKEGALFENFFCTQSICSPSRASFLTGTYAHIHGVNQNNRHVDPDWAKFKPYTQLLQEAGYETAHVGKIHMAHKNGTEHIRPGFDYWFSFNGQGDYFDPMVNDNGREYQEEGYMTDILTEKAITWLKEKRDKNKPFSLNLWHKAVHEDHSPAPRHENLYAAEELPEPPHGMLQETFAGKPQWQRIKASDAKWKEYIPVDSLPIKEWPVKGDKFMRLLKTLKAVDESLGQVLAVLEELGELDNTVIIYSSDNGYFMGEHGYWDKRIAYEASMRIPMLIRYPSLIQSEMQINELCLNVDMAPTILELAGVQQPSYMQGESMVNLLKHQENEKWRQSMLFQYYVDDEYPYAGPDMLAVRTDRYKLVDCFLEDDIDELYDLENDPGEMNNLIGLPEYADLENELRQEIEKLKTQYNYNPNRDWWLKQVIPAKKKRKLLN